MLKDYRILAVLAFLGFVLFALSLKKSAEKDYIGYQKEYYSLLGEEDFSVEIKQVNVKTPGSIMVDRCQTCHIGASKKTETKLNSTMTPTKTSSSRMINFGQANIIWSTSSFTFGSLPLTSSTSL